MQLLSEQSGFDLVEVNFERNPELDSLFKSHDPHKITQLISLQTGQTIRPGHTLLFLDEIQGSAEAIKTLRYFAVGLLIG